MAYHLGRILHLHFGCDFYDVEVIATGPSFFTYDIPIIGVTLPVMEQSITPDDVLIVNPSFSSYLFGLRLPGTAGCDYMRYGENCPSLPFSRAHELAQGIDDALNDEELSERVANGGIETAQHYGYQPFRGAAVMSTLAGYEFGLHEPTPPYRSIVPAGGVTEVVALRGGRS